MVDATTVENEAVHERFRHRYGTDLARCCTSIASIRAASTNPLSIVRLFNVQRRENGIRVLFTIMS